MIGFIKYKLFKWLWKDMCKEIDCDFCPMGACSGFGQCDKCDNVAVDCYDVESLMFKAARQAWSIE